MKSRRRGYATNVVALWERVFDKYGLARSDLADIVDWHLHPRDGAHRDRVVRVLTHLAG